MIHDITPRTGFDKYYEMYIEPRRLELCEMIGLTKHIEVEVIYDDL